MQLKKEAKNLISWIKCPCNARDGFELVSSLKIMSKSPTKVAEVILIYKANSTARIAANASTCATIIGRGISIHLVCHNLIKLQVSTCRLQTK